MLRLCHNTIMSGSNLSSSLDGLCAAGRFAEAAQTLFAAVHRGDAQAHYIAALWRIAGTIIRRDLADARKLLDGAAERDLPEASKLLAYLLAGGVGSAANWPKALDIARELQEADRDISDQFRLIDKMKLDVRGYPEAAPQAQVISERPYVAVFESFASPEECNYLIGRARTRLKPALVVDPESGQLIPHPIRKSDGMMFGVFDEDLVVGALNRRMAALSGTQYEQGEALQILSYSPGGEYRAHLDAVPATDNQRIATVLVYLTDDYEGGETHFLANQLSYKGKRGAALLFHNVTPDGAIDPAAKHAGLPVTKGTKVIASRWIRQRRLEFPPPTPALPGF